MKIADIKRKLKALSTSDSKEVLYDALTLYTEEEIIPEEIEILVKELKKQYISKLPKKEPKVYNVDLETSIIEIKKERDDVQKK